jgi:plastocyanin
MSRVRPRSRAAFVLPAALLALLILSVPTANAGQFLRKDEDGVRYMRYRVPIDIKPGQNDIFFQNTTQRPKVDGYITYFKPELRWVTKGKKVPPVDVIHLHHAVWIINGNPTFAAGEEKTIVRTPKGYGWEYKPTDNWTLNHMIHNLTPDVDKVWVEWTIGFLPKTAAAAKGMRTVDTHWMDVEGIQPYPVFDVLKDSGGKDGRFTYPDDQPDAYEGLRRPRNQWVVRRDTTIVGTAGHLHPGGLWTDLYVTRDGVKKHLFRSRAKYFEPAGPVSWDVSMTATDDNWRVKLKRGDVVSINATYGTRRGSWYESMGIMPLAVTEKPAGGKDPFAGDEIDTEGKITHGPLPENDNHGGGGSGLPDARKLADGPRIDQVPIEQFVYQQGDLSVTGKKGLPPVVAPGQALTFINNDGVDRIYHTVTSCKAPCNGLTGVAYPLAGGQNRFDSGQLAMGGVPTANRITWGTPTYLKQGTYNYFCRVHPFMRGAFRVKS